MSHLIPEPPTTTPTMVPAPPVPPTPTGVIMRDAGIVNLRTEFKTETIGPIVDQIIEWNLMPETKAPKHIQLRINSPGGSVHAAFELIDVMKHSRIPVHTLNVGLAASCGVLTLMAGAKGHRYISENASTMSHTYSWGSKGKEGELYAIMDEFQMSSERMIKHYKACSGKSEKYIRKNLLSANDVWLSPEEAIKHGLADHIIEVY